MVTDGTTLPLVTDRFSVVDRLDESRTKRVEAKEGKRSRSDSRREVTITQHDEKLGEEEKKKNLGEKHGNVESER